MNNYAIGCYAHKHYSVFAVLDKDGIQKVHKRIDHEPSVIREFLEGYPPGTQVALESVGNWYWIADEIEAAKCVPLLTHPAKAKVIMGNVNKTDKLDAKGLATLLRLSSLPHVWLPPGTTRDDRELPRTQMALTKIRTALKNQIHATLAKYHQKLEGGSEISSTQVSQAAALLDEVLEPWRNRPLGTVIYLYLDALYEKVRVDGQIRDAGHSPALIDELKKFEKEQNDLWDRLAELEAPKPPNSLNVDVKGHADELRVSAVTAQGRELQHSYRLAIQEIVAERVDGEIEGEISYIIGPIEGQITI